ncbi:nitrogenase component 1 [Succinispira mobilis]|uniref:nitrogenase component 1 n=1 Tax=Succinispira mobilis TaxID=78120 RepID=UPI0003645CC4|nr:nitrogenase component 1 [Succinispira mobilis]
MAIKTKRYINKAISCSCSMPGVWRATSYIQGGLVVFHSPKACSHITQVMDNSAFFRSKARDEYYETLQPVPLICSNLTDDNSIFGGEKKLKQCLEAVMSKYQPKFIVIANSCVAGVIGDDIESIASTIQEKYQVPVLAIPCFGFLDGEYYAGYYQTTSQLIKKFIPKSEIKQKDSVVLIGDNGGPNGEYAREVKSVLHKLGIAVIGQFPTFMTLEALPEIAKAEYSIVLGGRGYTHKWLLKIATDLKQQLAIPYYAQIYPIGWKNTKQWIQNMGVLFKKTSMAQAIIAQEEIKLMQVIDSLAVKLIDKQAVLCIGRMSSYFSPNWILELLALLKLELKSIVLLDGYTEKEKKSMQLLLKQETTVPIISFEQVANLSDLADLILTTHELQDDKHKQIILPMLPVIGVSGEIDFINKISQIISRRGIKGGVVYG